MPGLPERGARPRHRAGAWLIVAVLLLTGAGGPALGQALSSGGDAAAIEAGEGIGTACAEGAVNGFITISIAAATTMFSELILPAYPVLLGIGLGVGCTARIVAETVRARGYELWQGYGPSFGE